MATNSGDMEEHQPNWGVYVTEVDEEPAIIGVDLALHERAPLKVLPTCLVVVLYIQDTDEENGLPSEAELDKLNDIEDAIVEDMAEQTAVVQAGWHTGGGRRNIYLYVQEVEACLESVEATMEAFPEVDYESFYRDEDDWPTYFELLYPNEEEMNELINARVLDELDNRGDNTQETRPVTHWVFLRSSADRDAFEQQVVPLGFLVEEKAWVKSETGLPFLLVFSRMDSVELEHINAVTAQLHELAGSFNGMYDGWETEVVD